jgi:TrmH family RNA methyltransferase
LFTVPVVSASTAATIAYLQQRDIKICSAVVDALELFTECDLSGPVAIVLGSEQAGLSNAWRSASAVPVRIPMRGQADSLNVSVAAALLLYEAVRQRSA